MKVAHWMLKSDISWCNEVNHIFLMSCSRLLFMFAQNTTDKTHTHVRTRKCTYKPNIIHKISLYYKMCAPLSRNPPIPNQFTTNWQWNEREMHDNNNNNQSNLSEKLIFKTEFPVEHLKQRKFCIEMYEKKTHDCELCDAHAENYLSK